MPIAILVNARDFDEPQGFSAIIWKIHSRISLVTGLRRTDWRTREMSRQWAEAGTMPAHHRVGRHQNQSLFPGTRETAEGHPEQLVGNTHSGAGSLPFEHGELLAKREILLTGSAGSDFRDARYFANDRSAPSLYRGSIGRDFPHLQTFQRGQALHFPALFRQNLS